MDKRTSKRKAWKASCSYRYWRGPLNHRIINFPCNCCAFSLLELMICIETAFFRNERYMFVTYTLKSCFKAVNKFIISTWILLPPSIVWKSYIGFLVRLCIHNINFWSDKLRLFARKIINASGCNTRLDWQVKTTYSWCGLCGRKSLVKTNLTGVPSLTSPPPSLLFFRAPFYFAPLPTIWTPGTG